MTRARPTTLWSTCGCSPRATCSARASSSSTSSRVGGLSRSSASRRWSPCARRATTSTSSRWPRRSVCPSRWSTWTAARAAPPTRTSSRRAPSPRSTFSTGPDTTISSTNRAAPGPLLPCLPPLPGARHVQRFFLCVRGCKWSYFTPFFLSHDPPPCFIKGGAGGEPCVRVPALLPACLLCLLLHAPRWVSLLFTHPPLSFPSRSRFEGPGLLEAPPTSLGSASFPEAPLSFLAGSGAYMGLWKFLGDLPRVPGPPTLDLFPHRPHLHPAVPSPGPRPQLPALHHGSGWLGVQGGGAFVRLGPAQGRWRIWASHRCPCPWQCQPGGGGQPSNLCGVHSPQVLAGLPVLHLPVAPRPPACACLVPPLLGPWCLCIACLFAFTCFLPCPLHIQGFSPQAVSSLGAGPQ
ncbi:ubiquitin thioesterase OTUB1 isoform X1 [Saimiri boliviensis]|uniref:ubiquitin thioesterase OTUB1 isoform X1 n=1 Tax=Saimiri boliviensis TaxID=27679 RepID=UPI003D76C95D